MSIGQLTQLWLADLYDPGDHLRLDVITELVQSTCVEIVWFMLAYMY